MLFRSNAAISTLREAGAELVQVDLRPLDLRRTRRAVFALCEHEMWRAHREAMAARPEGYSGRIRALLEYGASLDDAKLRALDERVTGFQFAWEARVAGLDACLSPTTPGVAFPHEGTPPDSLADLTVIGTAAAVPAVSVPCGAHGALPVGVQVLAPRGADDLALDIAAVIEAARIGAGAAPYRR